jgi:hypothetical protein
VKARDGATTAAEKLTGVAKAALDDVKPCESVGIAPVPTAEEARGRSRDLPKGCRGAPARVPWNLKP